MAIKTLEFERTEVEVFRRPSRGRPTYVWVPGYYAVINGSRYYPPMRCREARSFASENGFSFAIAEESVTPADR